MLRVVLEGGPLDGKEEVHDHLPPRLSYLEGWLANHGLPTRHFHDFGHSYIRAGIQKAGRHVYRHESTGRRS